MDQSANLVPTPLRRRSQRVWLSSICAVLIACAILASLVAVDVTEYALVSRFGRVVALIDQPGLHLKAPFDSVIRIDRRITFSRPAPAEYLTVDKRNVVVESLATWRIAHPQRYVATVTNRASADTQLADVVIGEIGAVLGTYPAAALIAPDRDPERFRRIVSEIRERVTRFAGSTYGIEIVDVELLRLTLPEQNRDHVFERMKAERGKIAKDLRTAGELQARKIIAEADHERARIEAQSYADAQSLKAQGDAEASRIYASAYGKNPAFYKFLRTLQAYEKLLDENTTLFLPADAEVMRILRPRQGSIAPGTSPHTVTAKRKLKSSEPGLSVAGRNGQGAGSAPVQEPAVGNLPSSR